MNLSFFVKAYLLVSRIF